MKRGSTFICLLCLIALTSRSRALGNTPSQPAVIPVGAANTGAESSDTPKSNDGLYSSIWLRNVFDLKPIPPPLPPDPKPAEPPPNVKLQGITTILGDKRAIFSVQEPGGPGKPPAKEESYMLSEGQRQGMLEVLEINPQARTVKIKVDELVSTITFETNKPAGGPAPANMAGGGIPRPPGAPPPAFRPQPGGGYTPAGVPAAPAVPFRPVRTADNSQVSPQGGGGGYLGGYAQAGTSGGVSIPGSLFTQSPAQLQQQQPAGPVPSAEEQAVMVAVNARAHAAEVAAGTMPPLPPLPAALQDPASAGGENATGTGSLNLPSAPPALPPPGSKTWHK